MKKKILFVCIHNSARSQMAEAFVNALSPERWWAQSAGLEPGKLNPVAVAVMKEVGIDISRHRTKGVQEFIKTGEKFDFVVTVCDEGAAERCPVFPGGGKRVHMGFADPSAIQEAPEEKLRQTRIIRDQIRSTLEEWLKKAEK